MTSALCAASRAAGMSSTEVPRLRSAARRTAACPLPCASCSSSVSVALSWAS